MSDIKFEGNSVVIEGVVGVTGSGERLFTTSRTA